MNSIDNIILDVVRHLKKNLEPYVPIRTCGNEIIVPTKGRRLAEAVIRDYCIDRKYRVSITMTPELLSDDTRFSFEIDEGYSHLFNTDTDVYDFASKKQSLKKWEIELGIHHQELGFKRRMADIDCIKKVIFSGPCTIILWNDGTKTIVRCGPDDDFDKEKGIAMCILKKMFGSSHQMSKWMKEQIGEEEEEEQGFKLPPFFFADDKKIYL